ncbi:peptide ABC transporter substrate-binding protein [Candidatus Neptunochlamydia vexilliferae]|uniref:Oligopeptide-binding protein OppA n=1 Tax=Candidatus Neptunichlamydia vexilliferae TaxID=1651774 RepID=A0ABS0AZJ5_9BACT|nr:peptide ABC transporter substrate-binding protein [Candidatus Neptunochlamydia vexilliferae]MBF5058896.1 Oligopeptide-binding protein OppA [Candidatus Neptunochlamydia vexilliferae]
MRVFLFFLFIATICLFGCGKKKSSLESTNSCLNISIGSNLRTLDPRLGGEDPAPHIIRMLFDGLFRRDKEGVLAPAVVESYELSEDKKVYTFYLKKTFWNDGAPVTAYDFEYAWKLSLQPETLSHGAQYFYIIKNAKACVNGKLSVDQLGIQAIDAHTFRVELENPTPYFLGLLDCPLFFPIPKHLAEKDLSWANRLDGTFVSNGPFKLERWKRNDYILVVKNENYWDQDCVQLPGIHLSFIEDSMTQFYLFEKGKLDWVGSPLNKLSSEVVDSLTTHLNFSTLEGPFVYWFFINIDRFPLNNKKLRQALSYAINRKNIVENIFNKRGEPAQAVVAPCFKLGGGAYFRDNNVLLARRLFEEALEELNLTRETFPQIHLKYASGFEAFSRIAQEVQEIWRKELGIHINLEQADWPVHFTAVQKGGYDVGFMGWRTFTYDPIYMLQNFKHKNDMVNMSNWENEKYLELLEQSDREPDPEKRKKILIAAEQLLIEEMVVIPICFLNQNFSFSPRLSGVLVQASGDIDFKFAKLAPCQ